MKYLEFKKIVNKFPFFRTSMLLGLKASFPLLQSQLSVWTSKKYLIKLNRNLYTVNDEDRKARFSNFYLANHLYRPSYISLESALSYYGFIPERVDSVISLSTKKTQKFQNSISTFIYHNIRPLMYDDFVLAKDEYGNNFFIASPEKALIDFLYLRTKGLKVINKNIFDLSYRFQNLDEVDTEKLKSIAEKYASKKLIKLTKLLIDYIEEEKANA